MSSPSSACSWVTELRDISYRLQRPGMRDLIQLRDLQPPLHRIAVVEATQH
jgi:hypothetical protein